MIKFSYELLHFISVSRDISRIRKGWRLHFYEDQRLLATIDHSGKPFDFFYTKNKLYKPKHIVWSGIAIRTGVANNFKLKNVFNTKWVIIGSAGVENNGFNEFRFTESNNIIRGSTQTVDNYNITFDKDNPVTWKLYDDRILYYQKGKENG